MSQRLEAKQFPNAAVSFALHRDLAAVKDIDHLTRSKAQLMTGIVGETIANGEN